MKYCIVVPDGAADYPASELGGRTPLEAARTPHMDRAAREGLLGLTRHVPERMPPGSEVAMMSVAGYDPRQCYTGRGPLEAADLGIAMGPKDWAVRCNLVTVSDDTLLDFTAGHISTEEARQLIDALNAALGSKELSFHAGVSYRHVLICRGARELGASTVAPHDIVGQPLHENFPRGQGGELLADLMSRSRAVLESHEVNRNRVAQGKSPANMIWLWSPGRRPNMENFARRFGVRGAVISAVNLVRGIGRLIGWDVIIVPGATGYTDTDYAAKGRYAVDALSRYDLVLVHIEAPDEASHEGDVAAKVQAIERIDSDIVGPLMALADGGVQMRILIMPDHVTSVRDGKHKRDPVPFALWGAGVASASGRPYSEAEALASETEVPEGYRLMRDLVR